MSEASRTNAQTGSPPARVKNRVMERLKLYVIESYNELIHKVTWPTWANLQSSTVVVLVASLILASIIFLMDVFSRTILDFVYSL